MAVAYVTHANLVNATSATVTFNAPATVTAGHVWLCFATMRGGTGNTFTNVPVAFTLVSRTDNGTVDSLLVYRYTATGSETASASFATLTQSTSRVSITDVIAFSGANASGIVTETGTANATASATQSDTTAAATTANDAVAFFASVPVNSATTVTYSANLTAALNTGGNGGTSTASITGATGYALGALASGTTFSATFGGSGAGCAVAVVVPATAGGGSAPVRVPNAQNASQPAVVRATRW